MEEGVQLEDETGFVEELAKEVVFFIEEVRNNDSQEMRRAFCRSLFQFVDGVASDLKSTIVMYESPETIGDDFYLALSDKAKVIKNGEEKEVIKRRGFADNLDFSFEAYGCIAGLFISIKENNMEWESFKKCIAIRNRVVHPKSVSDLEVSNSDLKKMLKMFLWLNNKLCEVHSEVGMYFLRMAETIANIIDQQGSRAGCTPCTNPLDDK